MSDALLPPRKKKHVRKAEAETDPEFQIAPMIDILLVLLVFFMSISTTEVLQTNTKVRLPIAKDAKDSKPAPGQATVNVLYDAIGNSSSIDVDGKNVSVNDLGPLLAKRVMVNPTMRVFLRVDKDVRYEFTRSLLEAVGKSGVPNVTFAVVDKDVPK